MGEGGQSHALAALPPGRRPGTNYTEGWVGFIARLNWCGKSRPTGIRFPTRTAGIESLYQSS